jgi:thiol:disulfide interchange protein DsbD
MKVRFSLFIALMFATALSAQQNKANPVKWSFSTKDAGNCMVDLIITGTIDDGWYTYSQFQESEDGPLPTSLNFKAGPHFKLVGKAVESGDVLKIKDKVFDMTVVKFKHKAVFTQRVEVLDPSQLIVGNIDYMTCNDEMCMKAPGVDFSFSVPCKKGN